MKIGSFNSTLSCTTKCIRIILTMINKKVIFGLFLFSMLGACGTPTAMLGPAYTFTTTGNIAQTGFSYGSDKLITSYTGKTSIENIEEILTIYSEKHLNILFLIRIHKLWAEFDHITLHFCIFRACWDIF